MNRVTVVTGATGFLGKRVCELLAERGERCVAVGRNFTRFPELDASLCRRQVADLGDDAALREACRGADTIIHSAALSTPWGRREAFLQTNVEGTRRLLRIAKESGVRRFVHVSSSSVVFTGEDGHGVDEAAPYARTWLAAYPESKALAEQVVRGFEGLETVILRPRAIFGPGDPTMLPRIIDGARKGWLKVIGSGENVQDLTYVDNVVDALLLARDAPHVGGRVYFVSNDEPWKVWDVIGTVLDQLGLPRPKKRVPFPIAMAAATSMELLHSALPSLGEPRLTRYTVALLAKHQTLDISAAKRDLGYRPRVDMAEAIRRAAEACREVARG
ncbi:MAG: NAD-dependent epimerase/dehydratase family protein [Myxococcales bacterium]